MDSRRGLCRDQQGAILLIGLFVALSLIGALWMIIGIGDAILTHDLGQEAADAAALSSATVHARAMNATGAVNFVMLVLTGAYLLFSILADIAVGVAALFTLIVVGAGGGGRSAQIGQEAQAAYGRIVAFEQAMGRTFAGLDRAQTSLAVGAPYLGTLVGNEAANNYRFAGMTMGWSNFSYAAVNRREEVDPYSTEGVSIPITPAQQPVNCRDVGGIPCNIPRTLFNLTTHPPAFTLGDMSGRSLGLPVAVEPASTLCVRIGGQTFTTLGQLINGSGLPPLALYIQRAIGGFNATLPLSIHCSDAVSANTIAPILAGGAARGRDVWLARGPKRMTAQNGDNAMRILGWALSREEEVRDENVRRVQFGRYDLAGQTDRIRPIYNAQAEFFYDCDSVWHAGQCNDDQIGQTGVGYEQSLYWMRWRARLVRSHTPTNVFEIAINRIVDQGQRVADDARVPTNVWPRLAPHVRTQGIPLPTRNLH
jgi:hypothetical protein